MSSAPTFVQEMPLRVKPGETVLLEITARPHGETFAAGRFRLELSGSDLPAFVYLRGEDRDYKVPVRGGAAEHARLPRGRYGISLDEPPPRDSQPGRVRLVLSGDAYDGPLYLADAQRVYELKRDGDAFIHESVPPGDYELRMDQPEPRPGAGGVRLTLKAPESGNAPARAYLIADGGRPPVEVALRPGNGELTGDYPDLPPGKYRLSMSPPDRSDTPADNWLRRGDGEKLTVVFQDEKNMGEAAAGVIREMADLVGGQWGENLKSVKFIAYAAGEGGTRIRRESEALARSKQVAEAFARELKGRRTVDTRANFETHAPPGGGDVLIVQAEGERGPLLAARGASPCAAYRILGEYVVKKNDSILKILRLHWPGAPDSVLYPMIAEVKALNNLRSTTIHPGNKLRIPVPPDINPRSAWGAEPPKPERGYTAHPTPLERMYNTIVIHHAGDTNGPNMKDIQDKHFARNYADVGYHYGVDLQGRIWEGRDINYSGSHVLDQNTGKIGLVLMGDFESEDDHFLDLSDDTFTRAMETSALRMICYLKRRYPAVRYLGGHRDFRQTACPGNLVYPRLAAWRRATGLSAPSRS